MPAMGDSELCIHWFDNSQFAEPSEAYTFSHNVFTRCSPLKKSQFSTFTKAFQSLSSNNALSHVLVTFDEGSPQQSSFVRSSLLKMKPAKLQTLELMPQQLDLERRAGYKSGADVESMP